MAEALAQSDFVREFPEFTDHFPAIGIYGESCTGQRVLVDDDRIELYRPLVFDPLETRRRRAGQRRQMRSAARPDGTPTRSGASPAGQGDEAIRTAQNAKCDGDDPVVQ